MRALIITIGLLLVAATVPVNQTFTETTSFKLDINQPINYVSVTGSYTGTQGFRIQTNTGDVVWEYSLQDENNNTIILLDQGSAYTFVGENKTYQFENVCQDTCDTYIQETTITVQITQGELLIHEFIYEPAREDTITDSLLIQSNPLGWSEQESPTSRTLYQPFFINSTRGWVSGSARILDTHDGGESWSEQNPGFSNPIWSDIHFVDENTGVAVGSSGALIRTTDGGSTWSEPTTPALSTWMKGVYFPTSTRGWAVGNDERILYTSNGGSSWSSQDAGLGGALGGFGFNDVYFIDQNTGWAAGHSGTVVKTTNAGSSWSDVSPSTTNILESVYFINEDTGWIVGWSGTILRTTNGGSTWSAQSSPVGSRLRGVHFLDANNGWIVGDNGVILRTTNGGSSWTQVDSPTTESLQGMFFHSSSLGWAAGDFGTILTYQELPNLELTHAKTNTEGTQIHLTLDWELEDPSGQHGAFSYRINESGAQSFSSASLGSDNKTIILDLSSGSVDYRDVVDVSYTPGTIETTQGVVLEAITNSPVENFVPPQGAAVLLGTTTYAPQGPSSTHDIPLPQGSQGDLLVMQFRSGSDRTATTPSGWTLEGSRDSVGVTYVWSRISNGTEETAYIELSASGYVAANTYRFTNAEEVELAFASSNINDPPELTPSWEENTTTFIALLTNRRTNNKVSEAPTDFIGLITAASPTSDFNVYTRVSSALKYSTASTENPDAFTTSGTINSPHSATIAIKPSSSSCVYPGSGNWEILLEDNCVITDMQDASGQTVRITGSGSLTIDGGEVIAREWHFTPDSFDGTNTVAFINGGKRTIES